MTFKKIIKQALIILPIAFGAVAFIYFSDCGIDESRDPEKDWQVQKKKIRSRLLAVPILLYHNIDGKGAFSVTSKQLREHFRFFKKRGYQVVSLKDLMNRLDNPRPYNKKTIVLTFDDGYPAMYDLLLPIAEDFNYPITLFVYLDNVYDRATKSLTWAKLKKLDSSLIDIQCHTISHKDLTIFSQLDNSENNNFLYQELYLSRRIMEIKMNKKIPFIAFPYGRYDMNLLKKSNFAGYERVFSTDSGSNDLSWNNFCLRRHHIKSNFSLETIEKIIK